MSGLEAPWVGPTRRVETLKKLWLDGLSASQIAKQLGGVTRNAVIGKVHRLGLSGRAAPSQPSRADLQGASSAEADVDAGAARRAGSSPGLTGPGACGSRRSSSCRAPPRC